MKTQKAVNTHNAIVDAAEALFMQKGVGDVTVNAITRKAGVAKGTFYLYFASKDDLVWHFLEHKLDALLAPLQALEARGFTRADIHAVIDRLIGYIKEFEPLIQMIHQVRFYGYLGKSTIEQKYFGVLAEPVCRWVSRGMEAGCLKAGDPRFTAYFLTASVHNMIECVISRAVPYTVDELGGHLKSLLTGLLLEG